MEIDFYETASSNSPIEKFLDQLNKADLSVILAVFTEISEHGINAKGAAFKNLDGKLWEIKVRAPGGGFRFLYVLIRSDLMIILHAFKKKTQKTPIKELKLARKRLSEVLK